MKNERYAEWLEIEEIKRIIDEFDGKEIFYCGHMGGGRVHFDVNVISLCHETELEIRPKELILFRDMKEFSVRNFYKKIYELLKQFQNPDYPCRKCSRAHKTTYRFLPLSFIVVSPSMYCNSNCIYCQSHSMIKAEGYNPIPMIKELFDYKLVAENCLFDWGGGEPTQCKWFEETVEYISGEGYFQRINTNAISFSQATYNVLPTGRVRLRISVDSGTRECFEMVKGHSEYASVWENISRYCEANAEMVDIKYNVCNYNSDLAEVDYFLDKCKQSGVRNIHIDGEADSYQKVNNVGPFYFRQQELDAARYMERRAEEMGFCVTISGYAFGTRPVYKANGQLALPDKWFDNIDHETISNDIFVTTFANVGNMLRQIQKNAVDSKCIVWGAGAIGLRLATILEYHGIEFVLADGNEELVGKQIGNQKVQNIYEVMETEKNVQMILATRHFRSMLRTVNEKRWTRNGLVYWISGIVCENYIFENGIE